jgi:hypothetical protein
MKTNTHFLIISRQILVRWRTVSDKSCKENQNAHFVFKTFFSKIKTHILCSKTFFSPENRVVYETNVNILYNRAGHS